MVKKEFLRDFIICIALFLIMFSTRTLMAPNFHDIGNPDAAWAAMQTEYLIKHGYQYPYNDTKTLFPIGRIYYPNQIGWWLVGAVGYKIAAFITGTTGFDQQLLTTVMMWLSAIVSSLAAPFIFLLIRELFGIEAGILAALFLCFYIPTFYYTSYGNPENDGLGLALFFGGLWAFVRYLKSGKWYDLLIFTIINLWSSLTWQAYGVLSVIVGMSSIFYTISVLFLKYIKKKEISFEKIYKYNWLLTCLLVINLFGVLNHVGDAVGNTVIIAALILNFILYVLEKRTQITKDKTVVVAPIVLILLILFGGISQLFTTLSFAGINLIKSKPVNPEVQKYTKIVYETIAEQQPIKKSAAHSLGKPLDEVSFFDVIKYLSDNQLGWVLLLFIVTLIMLFIVFVYDLIVNGKINELYISLVIVGLYALITLVKKPVSLFFLSGLCALGFGIFIGMIINFLKKINKMFSLSFSILTLIIILMLTPTTIVFAETMNNGLGKSWSDTLKWIKNNTENGSIITSWWDYGHYYGYYLDGHNRYTIDNIQYGPFIHDVATAFTNTPCSVPDQRELDKNSKTIYVEVEDYENGKKQKIPITIIPYNIAKEFMKNNVCNISIKSLEDNEKQSLKILEKYKTDYILIDKEIILGKLNALQHIAGKANGIFDTSVLTRSSDGKLGFVYHGIYIPISTQEYFKAQIWPGAVIEIPGTDKKIRILIKGKTVYIPYYYSARYYDSKKWQITPNLDPNAPVLFQFMSRIFFHDPHLKYVKPVYDNGDIVIYKVDWNKYFKDKVNKND